MTLIRPHSVTPLPLELNHLTTPRDDFNEAEWKKLSIPYTPVGDEADIYKYYCPLCMQFFTEILKSPCCGNYICVDCFKDYLISKGIDKTMTKDVDNMLENVILEDIVCPHCTHYGFQPKKAVQGEIARDYSRAMPLLQFESTRNSNGTSANIGAPPPSPLRIGETFEDLKRKMIPFKLQNKLPPLNSDSHSPSSTAHRPPDQTNHEIGNSDDRARVRRLSSAEEHNVHVVSPMSAAEEGDARRTLASSRSFSSSKERLVPISLFPNQAIGTDTPRLRKSYSGMDGAPHSISRSANEGADPFIDECDRLSEASPLLILSRRLSKAFNANDDLYDMSTFSLNLESSSSVYHLLAREAVNNILIRSIAASEEQ